MKLLRKYDLRKSDSLPLISYTICYQFHREKCVAGRQKIPEKVKQTLRREVGFGCPVQGCANPYLEYHHFDPPVKVKPHNNPEGMIALCAQHHKKADGGAYTNEQLHALKKDKANANDVKGNLDWLRRDLLAVVGGVFYYETLNIVRIDGVDVVSLDRDEEGYLRLSINMLSLSSEERIVIDKNSWERVGYPSDLRSPPQGKELEVSYSNGDYLYLRFWELKTKEQAQSRYNSSMLNHLRFPITAIEVNLVIAGTGINLSPDKTTIGGLNLMGGLIENCGVGVCVEGSGFRWLQNSVAQRQESILEIEGNVISVQFRRPK
ncbi:conserved hypothetical protein [Vibrio parahaemolyticus]